MKPGFIKGEIKTTCISQNLSITYIFVLNNMDCWNSHHHHDILYYFYSEWNVSCVVNFKYWNLK